MTGYGMELTPELWHELSGDVALIAQRLGWSRWYCRRMALTSGLLAPKLPAPTGRPSTPHVTKHQIKVALRENKRVKAAAEALGMTRDQLRVSAKRYGIDITGRSK